MSEAQGKLPKGTEHFDSILACTAGHSITLLVDGFLLIWCVRVTRQAAERRGYFDTIFACTAGHSFTLLVDGCLRTPKLPTIVSVALSGSGDHGISEANEAVSPGCWLG